MILFYQCLEIYSDINFFVLLHMTKFLLLNIRVYIVYICMKWNKSESRSVVFNSSRAHGLCGPWNSPGQNTGVGSLSLLQGIFPTQRSNPGIPHCRQIFYQLRHKGSPYMSVQFSRSVVSNSLRPHMHLYIHIYIYKVISILQNFIILKLLSLDPNM